MKTMSSNHATKSLFSKITGTMVPAIVASTIGLVGCSSPSNVKAPNSMIDVDSIAATPAVSTDKKAEEIARRGEALFFATGHVQYADEIFSRALVIDPQNVRAQLYKAALAPIIELRGIQARLEPYYVQTLNMRAKYEHERSKLKQDWPADFADFLVDARADIATEAEIQEVVARAILKMDQFRTTVANLRDQELVLYVPDKHTTMCSVRKSSKGVYAVNDKCDLKGKFAVPKQMNRADMEGLQIQIAGMQAYLTLLNAYDLSGVGQKEDHLKKIPRKHAVTELFTNPAFGTLRRENAFGVMPSVLKDAVVGFRYALAIEKVLCNNGKTVKREGHLISSGVCFSNKARAERTIAAIETMLGGVPAVVEFDGRNGTTQHVTMNILKLFTQPIADLRSEQLEWTANGEKVTKVGDGTFNGVFPTGDLNKLLTENASR